MGIRDRPIIICEGTDDDKFLKIVAPLFNVEISAFEVISCGGRTTHISTVVDVISSAYPSQKIIVILDPDFCVNPLQMEKYSELQNKKGNKLQILFWSLPSIESFLFLYFTGKNNSSGKLTFFHKNISKFAEAYCNGFRTQNLVKIKTATEETTKQISSAEVMFASWNECLTELQGSQNLVKIAKVLHGHTWTQVFRDEPTQTAQLILEIGNDFPQYCFGQLESVMLELRKIASRK